MKSVIAFVCVMLFPFAAQAAPQVDQALCQQLTVAYKPPVDPKQSADYVAGIDAKGKPVVEADLNPQPQMVPETVSFPILLDVAKYAGIGVPTGTELQSRIGTVEINVKTGEITYNGEPLEGPQVQALKELCAATKPADPATKKSTE